MVAFDGVIEQVDRFARQRVHQPRDPAHSACSNPLDDHVINANEELEIVSSAASDVDRIRQLELLGATIAHTYLLNLRDPDRFGKPRVGGWTYRLPARFVFTGRGYGHGVGMSQWGAQGMALAGKSAEEILTHYYQGIAITSIGGA